MRDPLSAKRRRLLETLAGYEAREQVPLVRELAHDLGLRHESSLRRMLDALVEEEFLARQGGGAARHQRIFRLTLRARGALGLAAPGTLAEGALLPFAASRRVPGEGGLRLPVLGSIAAGPWREAVAGAEEEVELASALRGRPGDFFLRISGDSMIEAGIWDGDLALVRPGVDVGQGEIGAVQLEQPDGSFFATLKRVYQEPGAARLVLRAANSAYADIVLEEEALGQAALVGAYRGLIRAL